mmetsp:Transcript_18144/g.33524  ORF Transcript_18144/g.33524 Transcript_18144/m.33524 type:complete len:755 (+) Transcript_18144:399-2663(+)|eukprot:CAMPEP_0184546696 /NCGR_PEP_ID=MMETSP0199_2-20130426/5107_1 /TAXON_ID=1112570 /ORGANISM="Thraustochytrium sp., Strain LLF1b" /LENGTH=754 /DNA_ID=CAMNT_0026941123 /DNA_START=324 /DNA_END=2588 /DNA_ORIENTATION=-
MRRGISLPVSLEAVNTLDSSLSFETAQDRNRPSSPSSVGSHSEERLTPNSASLRRAQRKYNNAKRQFEEKEYVAAIHLLKRSISEHPTPMAEALLEQATQQLRISQEDPSFNNNNNKLRSSCPSSLLARFSEQTKSARANLFGSDEDSDSLNFASQTTNHVLPAVTTSMDTSLYRTSSTRSEGYVATRKPPKLRRSKKINPLSRSLSSQGIRSLSMPHMAGGANNSPGRKRFRASHDSASSIFDMHKMEETLQDAGHGQEWTKRGSINFSHDSTISNISAKTFSTMDNDCFAEMSRTQLFSASSSTPTSTSTLTASSLSSSACTSSSSSSSTAFSGLVDPTHGEQAKLPSMPLATDSPPYLPRNRSRQSTPLQGRGIHAEELLLEETEEKVIGSPSKISSGATSGLPPLASTYTPKRIRTPGSNSISKGSCSPIKFIGRPQFTESPQMLNLSGGRGRGTKSRFPPGSFERKARPTGNANTLTPHSKTEEEENIPPRINLIQNKVTSRKRSQRDLQTPRRIPDTMPYATPTREELLSARANVDVCEQVNICKAHGIKMLALDFDNTFVDTHTKGAWAYSSRELQGHIRPLFRSLIPAIFKQGLVLSIVTFSPQVDLIKDLLLLTFPSEIRLGENTFVCGSHRDLSASAPGPSVLHSMDVAQTPVPTRQSSNFCVTDAWLSPTRTGKKNHITKVCNEYSDSTGRRIPPEQVLLVDDDLSNILAARKTQMPAIWFQADDSKACEHLLIQDLQEKNWS